MSQDALEHIVVDITPQHMSPLRQLLAQQDNNAFLLRRMLQGMLCETNVCFRDIYIDALGCHKFLDLTFEDLPEKSYKKFRPSAIDDIQANDMAYGKHRKQKRLWIDASISVLIRHNDTLFAALYSEIFHHEPDDVGTIAPVSV